MNNQSLKGQTTMLRQVSDEVRNQEGTDCAAHAMTTAIRATVKWINENCNIILPEIPHHELLPECTLAYYGRTSSQGKRVRKERGEKMINNNKVSELTQQIQKWTRKAEQNTRINSFLNKYGIDRIVTYDKDLVIKHLEAGEGANATISIHLTPKIENIFLRILYATNRKKRKSDTLEDYWGSVGIGNPNFVIEKEHIQSYGDHPIHGMYERISTYNNWWRHAMTIAGYNLDPPMNQETQHKPPPYWIIKNSWGDDFVDGGYFRVAMNAFEDCEYVTKGLEKIAIFGDFAQFFLDPVGLCKVEFAILKPSDEICKGKYISITEPNPDMNTPGEFEEEDEIYWSFGMGGKRRKHRKTKTHKRKRKRKRTIKKKRRRRGRKSRKR